MKLFIVTGSSKGLGKAIAQKAAKNHLVIGLSRTNDWEANTFNWIETDFSHPENLPTLPILNNASEVVLINNAGSIGPIKKIGHQDTQELQDLFNINVTSVFAITNQVVQWVEKTGKKATIINVSSGAAEAVIDGWSAYCSSKAAVDSMSEILQHECKMNGLNVKVHSLRPGVVDSPMQAEIRTASKDQFSRLDDFVGMKENGELASPEEVAEKVFYLIDNPKQFEDVKVSVRDFEVS